MRGRFLAVVSLLVAAGLLAGCGSQPASTTDSRLLRENTILKSENIRIGEEREQLETTLLRVNGELAMAKLGVEEWKRKYEIAEKDIPDSPLGGLPEEQLQRFLDIARAGGSFQIGADGRTLKASSDILFSSGKKDLKKSGQAALKQIALKLKEILTHPRVMLSVDGHTDNDPIKKSGWENNRHLSCMRAMSVVIFLAQQGVPEDKMVASGLGEWYPVSDNTTKEGRAQNRRVELRLIAAKPK